MRRLLRPLLGALIGFLLFAGGYQLVTTAYYYLMPGKYWVNYYYAHVDNLTVGEAVALTLCRDTHYDNFKLEATRTFVYQLSDGRETDLGEYDLKPTINNGPERCQTIQIPADRQPQRPGIYQLRTTATFYIEGNRKTISYVTNQYQLTDTQESLNIRIDQLQQQLNQLRSQQTGQPVSTQPISTTSTVAVVPSAQPTASSTATSSPTQTTSAPPDPPQSTAGDAGLTLLGIPVPNLVRNLLP